MRSTTVTRGQTKTSVRSQNLSTHRQGKYIVEQWTKIVHSASRKRRTRTAKYTPRHSRSAYPAYPLGFSQPSSPKFGKRPKGGIALCFSIIWGRREKAHGACPLWPEAARNLVPTRGGRVYQIYQVYLLLPVDHISLLCLTQAIPPFDQLRYPPKQVRQGRLHAHRSTARLDHQGSVQ